MIDFLSLYSHIDYYYVIKSKNNFFENLLEVISIVSSYLSLIHEFQFFLKFVHLSFLLLD